MFLNTIFHGISRATTLGPSIAVSTPRVGFVRHLRHKTTLCTSFLKISSGPVLATVCGIPNSAEFAFPNTQSVELLRRERRRAVRPSWGEYRDQRHRSKRTNVVRTRGELGKADADVSKDAPFDARRPPDRAQSTRGHPTYNKSLFYCRFDVIPAWVVRSMPLAGAARLAQG